MSDNFRKNGQDTFYSCPFSLAQRMKGSTSGAFNTTGTTQCCLYEGAALIEHAESGKHDAHSVGERT